MRRISRQPIAFWIMSGYLTSGKAFSYLGVNPLFIGEAYLAAAVCYNRNKWINRFISDCIALRPLALAFLLNFLWGVVEVVRCLYLHRDPVEVLRTFSFTYYTIYLLIGMAVGRDLSMPDLVRLWKAHSIFFVVAYFVAMAVAPDLFEPTLPAATPVMILALWTYMKDWWPRFIVMGLSIIPSVSGAGRNRAIFIALAVGVVSVMLTARAQLGKFVVGLGGVVLVLFIINPFFPADADWAAPLDPVSHVAGVIATFYPDVAVKMMKERGHIRQADVLLENQGTATWRKFVWAGALDELHQKQVMLIGIGGGHSIQHLTPDHADIHTPHNFTIFVLYYLGAIGLGIFILFLLAILLTGRNLRHPALRAGVCAMIWSHTIGATMGNLFEAPMGAIPLYLLCGMMIGLDESMNEHALYVSKRALRRRLENPEPVNVPETDYGAPRFDARRSRRISARARRSNTAPSAVEP